MNDPDYKFKKVVAAGYIGDFKMFISFVDTKEWGKRKFPAFNTHETRVINISEYLLASLKTRKMRNFARSEKRLKDFILQDGTIAWPKEGFYSKDFLDRRCWIDFDCDPTELYLACAPVKLAE